ncbi:centromere protein Q isoform X2 [Herpailurus yagouaroundi]|uniref:centromere protein Q isoform X2 n=1 Tax=Herpailurus yagouaroundi TaxID=1608482 RepID=UPI001AD71F72|nr:centromere protein Q isoform X2 [Puma yagouaroundi]
MSNKAGASKKRPQQLKKNPKRKTDDEEVELPERKVRNTAKNKNPKHLPSEVTGRTENTNLKRVKVAFNKRKTWQPLSKRSREHLQAMMESVIITILSNNIREHEQVQYHLNYLKKRLLQLCENLKVPPKKLKDLTNVSSLLKMERAEHRANEEGLALLQMFQIDSGVLCLPELSQKSLKAPTLQKEILTLIPNHNALLKDLDVLHNSPQMKNMLTFIEEAYKRLDAS